MHRRNTTRRKSLACLPFACATFLIFLAGTLFFPLHAQVAGTGTIQGTVADPTGAVVPNAKVMLTEEATRVVRTIQSDSAGVYIFPNITPGTYTVNVSAQGFQTFVSTHNTLEVGSNIAISAKLAVGQETQTVEVSAQGNVALQTEDVKFKQTVDEKEISELPLNSASRQITGLLTLSGGTNPAPSGDFTGSKYSYQTISVSVAGGGGNTTLWRLDGGDNNDYMANGNLPFPFPDALSQFSVENSVLGAQDGMHSGGLVNVVTRSGTNRYHGSAFEFIRNNYLNASNFYSAKPDSLHQNQFGGTFGGPILRDRLFAFAGYQRLQNAQSGTPTNVYVPTPAMLAGDFSQCSLDNNLTLYDPTTGTPLVNRKYATAPNYSPASLALVKYLPTAASATSSGIFDSCGQVTYFVPVKQTDNQFVTRVDWTINPKNHFYGRYFIDGFQQPSIFLPENILVTTQSGNIQRVQSYTMGEDWTLSSTIVNSVHATLLRRSNNRGYASTDINAATLGVNIFQAVPNGLQLAGARFTIGGGTNSVAHFNDNTLAIDDDVTMVRGKHQFVFGGEFVRNQLNISNGYESNGNFGFSSSGIYSGNGPTGTGKGTNGAAATGEPLLDFLAGTLSSFEQSKQQQNALRAPIPSLYIQDTWHATKQLTLIAGIRWSPNFFPYDYFDRGTTFNNAAFLANKTSTVYPNAPAGTFFYGDPGVTRAFTNNTPWQFSPNFGFAYDLTGNGTWVVRGGAEFIYDQVNFFTGQRVNQNPPFASAIANAQTSASGPLSFDAPWSRGTITTSPFPQPVVPTPSQAQFFAQSQYIVLVDHFHPSNTMQYTLSVQHQFGHGWQGQIDYIGNKSSHMPMGVTFDPAVYIPGVWGAGGTGCAPIVTTGPAAVKPGAAGTPCSTTTNQNSRYALTIANPAQGNQYKGGGGGSVLVADYAYANYNGVIATAQHRISNSFSVLANYTLSKCLNVQDAQGDYATTNIQNPANVPGDYGPCGSDYRNVENVVVVAKSAFKGFSPLVRALVNNWEISPIFHITSGAPINVTNGSDISLTNTGNDRPNRIPGVPVYLGTQLQRSTNRGFLNPAAFCPGVGTAQAAACAAYQASPGTFGVTGRNSFRGRPYYQTDAQISRIFPIHERLNAQVRFECFNFLNHPSFGGPTSTTTSSTFGQISSTSGEGPRIFQGSFKINF